MLCMFSRNTLCLWGLLALCCIYDIEDWDSNDETSLILSQWQHSFYMKSRRCCHWKEVYSNAKNGLCTAQYLLYYGTLYRENNGLRLFAVNRRAAHALLMRYWPFVRGIHRSPVNSPHKGQWHGALMFSLICTWMNDWINNREAGDLRCHRVMTSQ